MSEVETVNNVKRTLYTMVTQYYNTYMSDKSKLNKDIYVKVLELYKKINKCKSLNEIKVCLDDIKKDLVSLRGIYSSKLAIYEKMDKSVESAAASALLGEIKDITQIAQALSDVHGQTKAMISRMTPKKSKKVVKEETPKSPVREEKPKNTVKVKREVNLDGVDLTNPIVNALHKYTDLIIDLKEKLAKMDAGSKDATEIRVKINEYSDKRMDIGKKLFGNDGVNFIRLIESLETRLAHTADSSGIYPYDLSEDDYIEDLDEILMLIAELRFYGEESKYVDKIENYDEIYKNCSDKLSCYITSVFGEENPIFYTYGDYSISVNDLLSYLSVYNLSGGYQNFKDHHKTGKLGNEAISKEMYASGLDRIEGYISALKEKAREIIKTNGGNITIKNSILSKDDIRYEIDSKLFDLYRVICEKMPTKNSGVSL